MAIQSLERFNSGSISFRVTTHHIYPSGLPRFRRDNHSGLGNHLSKMKLSQKEIKNIYTWLRKTK
jgi:hypothetical protein